MFWRIWEKLEEFLKYMSMLLESKLYTDEANSKLEEQLKAVHTAESAWSFVGDRPQDAGGAAYRPESCQV